MEIIEEILVGVREHGKTDYRVICDRREAIRYALEQARCGDVILLAGKGHETYEINRTGRHPFDEKEIVAQIAVQLLANRREKQKND